MSQPPYQPVQTPQGGGVAQAPAAPTQVVFPGQVQLPPQPQYTPQPQQVATPQFAVGFPHYRSPAPSPKNRTSLIVGTLVVILTILFAVIGFWIVS